MRLRSEAVTREMLAAFATASGDANPLHLHPQVARAGGHDDVIAHGMLTMAWLGRLLTENSPQGRLRSFRVRFVAPMPLGATATLSAEVSGTRELSLRAELEDGTVTAIGDAVFDPA